MNKNLILQNLSFNELQEYKKDVKLAIIPIGSTEQHGPNMAFSTDSVLAFEISKKLSEYFFPRVLVCPAVQVGNSYHHMDFIGTFTIRPETFIQVIMEMAESLRKHHFNQILLLNGHGGNRNALGVAVTKMKFELGIKTAWIGPDLGEELWEKERGFSIVGHACELEVSMALYLAPWLVKNKSLSKGILKDSLYKKRSWWKQVPWSFNEITENGALGDATLASYELGEKITKHVLKKYQTFIKEYFFQH